ncbi:Glutarate-semialdehyde dehydrogenase [Georgfuchsia toluolica]|uniref:Glutarate-semialdehyde dehydrogenase n=1 Tax=Georgfuchsia toluolica TaxID=424218 RepID=A0A916J2G3_9PROT|nr:NAD-dependent succinate-semialdehyde dehydrogenase [Georgfuchsia toluolica]CAG4882766.1 Glutarate-semialdehyde dehydrogenase [Georgfuchsia toluolica]
MELSLNNLGKGLYINGIWRAASDGKAFDVINPATEEVLATIADGSVEDGLDAVAAAHAAGPAWAATPPRQRSEILRRAFELMIANKEALARLITQESGKALSEARGEVVYAAEFLRWFSEEAVRILGDMSTSPSGDKHIMVIRQPIGVAVFVTPWNFPAAMATRKIGPALAAGCTVVLKPAKETPLTALAMASIFEQAGVPPGVVNILTTRRTAKAIEAMLNDLRVRKFSFTGSTEIGRVLLAQAAQTVVKCSMELGGNAPFIVFADADIEVAVAAAMVAKMRNGGESCTAANRFYVEKPVAEEFTRRFVDAMAKTRMGNGLDENMQLGSMVNASTRNKIAELVDDAVAHGARLCTGGKIPAGKGYFYPATVLADVANDAGILKEEVFGPVAPIATFESEAEVIALANDTEMGLVSFVCTRDLAKALRVAEKLDSGMVGINRGIVADPAAPFGGWKQSGVGREGAHDGLLEYLESKYIAVTW